MALHPKSILHLRPTYELITSRMLFSLGLAVTTVGLPILFVENGMSDAAFGIFMGVSSLVAAITSLYSPPILERYNELRVLILASVMSGLAYLFLGYVGIPIAIALVIIHNIGVTININAQSILFKDSTRSKAEFTRDIGLMGSLLNLSWFIGPLLGGFVLSAFGVKGLFFLAGSFCILSGLYVSLMPFKTRLKHRVRIDGDLRENIGYYLTRRPLRIAFIQKMGITVWWGFIWTFMPIFMLNRGYSVATIGVFIALTQLPLFLLEFKTSFAALKTSYRAIFLACYLALAALCLAAVFAGNFNWVLIGMLFGSIPLSFLEPIADLYFFDSVSVLEEEKTFPLYAISSLVGSTVAKISVGATLLLLPSRIAFLVMSIIMVLVAWNALGIRKSTSAIR